MEIEQWGQIPSKIIKAELQKRGLNYEDLTRKLAAIGVDEKRANIKAKFSRGSFGATFFIQCLRAIGVKTLQLDDVLFENGENVN